MTAPTKVTLSLTDEPTGYGQHMLIIERDGPHWDKWSDALILTDNELDKLISLLNEYRAAGMAMDAFLDDSGRP